MNRIADFWTRAFKTVSHYTANLLQPAIDGCQLEKFPIFCSDLHRVTDAAETTL